MWFYFKEYKIYVNRTKSTQSGIADTIGSDKNAIWKIQGQDPVRSAGILPGMVSAKRISKGQIGVAAGNFI